MMIDREGRREKRPHGSIGSALWLQEVMFTVVLVVLSKRDVELEEVF